MRPGGRSGLAGQRGPGGRRRLARTDGAASAPAAPAEGFRARGFQGGDALGGNGPVVPAAFFDGVFAHAPDVEEESLTVAGSQVEDGAVVGDFVFDGLAIVPFLRGDGHGPVALRELLFGHQRNARGGGIANDLGEDPDHIVEVADGAQAAVPPGGVIGAAAHGAAAFAFRHQAAVQRRAHHLHAQGDEGIEIVIEWIAEGRHKDDRAGGTGLVVVIHDLREPLQEHDAIHVGGLRHVRHVEIAVVVVADVFVVEAGQVVEAAQRLHLQRRVGAFGPAHVPVGDELLAVGIGLDIELDAIVEQAHGLGVGTADHLVDHFHELLRTDGFGGVQAAIDPDHGLTLARQRVGLGLADTFGQGELAGDLAVMVQVADIRRRRNDGHVLAPAFGGGADIHQLHAIGFSGQLFPIGFQLGVIGHLVIVADVEAERLLGRSDAGRGLRVQQARRQHRRDHEQPQTEGSGGHREQCTTGHKRGRRPGIGDSGSRYRERSRHA